VTLAEAFEHQAISCEKLDSPFMARLLTVLAGQWSAETSLGRRVAGFTGDIGPAGASVPLRLCGGLHALVLRGLSPELSAVYPPAAASDDGLAKAVASALRVHEAFLLDWIESPPQTNDVRRAAALMAGATVVRAHVDLPVALSELGASGGLNMMWDRYALALPGARIGAEKPVLTLAPEWDGPLPPRDLPVIAERAGVDLNPLDPAAPEDLMRLMAFLWPDQPQRLSLTHAAAGAMAARIDRGDAIGWLERRLADVPDGHVHLIQHTVAWQYFPPETQARGEAMIEAAGHAATSTRPLAWLAMESDGDTKGTLGAALTLRLWPGDLRLDLGRADFHGRWIKWQGVT
jgi:hypothetical protein